MIRWRATDDRNGQEVLLSDNTDGIEISTVTEDRAMNEAISELIIEPASDFTMPVCEAQNRAGSGRLPADEFLGVGGMSKLEREHDSRGGLLCNFSIRWPGCRTC